MPRCPDCDEPIRITSTECPACGAKLPAGGGSKKAALSVGFILLCVLGFCCFGTTVVGLAVGIPAVQQARNAARLDYSRNNLRQMGLAIHNYHDSFMRFPVGVVASPEGEKRQAWMTALLPYVEQSPLYGQIDTNRPYTDPKNKLPFSTVIKTYQQADTTPMVNGQGYALAHYAGNPILFGEDNRAYGMRDMTDGSSNTFFAGEVADGFVPWGAPGNTRDLSGGIGRSPTQYGSMAVPNRATLLMADGSVRTLANTVNPTILKAIQTHNGNENINGTY